jgi:hypothetical protein
MNAKDDAMTPSDDAKGKTRQKYDRPIVVVYGDIRDITRTVGSTSAMNDGGSGKTKTA